MIRTLGLTMAFPRLVALDDLSVEVGSGVTGLVGANGAGKSTLLKILLGLQPPTAGQAQVLGLDVSTRSADIRRMVGYMPEHDCLPPDVNAADFVVHMGQMSGLPRTVARERASDMLRHVGLGDERFRPMGGYSTGMKQRAKLAQALVHSPSLVMLDEPTNGLDPAARRDMLELIGRIGHDFGIPVLVTSHLLGELEKVSDQVVVLDAGRLLRAQRTSAFTRATGAMVVEVLGGHTERDQLGHALAAAGLSCWPSGQGILVQPPAGINLLQVVRDTVLDLGLGLVRLEPHRGHLEDVFTSPPPGTPPPTSPPPGPPVPAPTPTLGGPHG